MSKYIRTAVIVELKTDDEDKVDIGFCVAHCSEDKIDVSCQKEVGVLIAKVSLIKSFIAFKAFLKTFYASEDKSEYVLKTRIKSNNVKITEQQLKDSITNHFSVFSQDIIIIKNLTSKYIYFEGSKVASPDEVFIIDELSKIIKIKKK